MPAHPVSLAHGARLDVTFSSADDGISALREMICDVAEGVAAGRGLPMAVRAAAQRHAAAARAFDIADNDAALETQFALGDALTFPDEALPHGVGFERGDIRLSLELDGLLARDLRAMLELCGSGHHTAAEIERTLDEPLASLFESLLEHGMLVTSAQSPSAWPTAAQREPGVTRLQHAGLLFRGRNCGVLIDPHLHSNYEPTDLADDIQRRQLEGLVDAIAITHSHRDHLHLPTLMSFPADILIVVPKVARASMLCPDFAATLRALGFSRVVALDWYAPPLRIGDLELHALPFYGEQPLLAEAPRHPDLRNHGNSYLVRHESYTSWLLVDSGDDARGRMRDVASEVRERFGQIDHVISNMREFAPRTPLYITGGHYWLALAADQMRRFASMSRDLITLGPGGVAEVCQRAGARQVLPYAHWWGPLFGAPSQVERALLARVHDELAARGSTTEIHAWRIGDRHR